MPTRRSRRATSCSSTTARTSRAMTSSKKEEEETTFSNLFSLLIELIFRRHWCFAAFVLRQQFSQANVRAVALTVGLTTLFGAGFISGSYNTVP